MQARHLRRDVRGRAMTDDIKKLVDKSGKTSCVLPI